MGLASVERLIYFFPNIIIVIINIKNILFTDTECDIYVYNTVHQHFAHEFISLRYKLGTNFIL